MLFLSFYGRIFRGVRTLSSGIVALAAAVLLAALTGIAGLSGGGSHLQPALGSAGAAACQPSARNPLCSSREESSGRCSRNVAGQPVVRRAHREVHFAGALDQPHLDFALRGPDNSSLISRATAGGFRRSGGRRYAGSAASFGFARGGWLGFLRGAHFFGCCAGVRRTVAIGRRVLFRRVLRCRSRGARFRGGRFLNSVVLRREFLPRGFGAGSPKHRFDALLRRNEPVP